MDIQLLNLVALPGTCEGVRLYHKGVLPFYEIKNATVEYDNIFPFVLKDSRVVSRFFGDVNPSDYAKFQESLAVYANNSGQPKKRLPEVAEAAFLASIGGSMNYWHFLFEDAPTIMELESAGFAGKYIFPANLKNYIREPLELLLDAERIMWINEGEAMPVANLVIQPYQFNLGNIVQGEWTLSVRNRILPKIPDLMGGGNIPSAFGFHA
ncbi:MAG: glycosyltransferase family 61 protein [Alphaproteobacteria bacterium]|nr:glycosyltransferase family 61 protein [Alphaproteobacteria bacterium]